jgi:hypothetical protein
MIVDVHERRLDSRTAAGVPPLLNSLLRALGAAELEQKIFGLERKIEKLLGRNCIIQSYPERQRAKAELASRCK